MSCSGKSPFVIFIYQDANQVSYIPSGSSKFGAFTIETIAGESALQYRLFIDGQERWSMDLVSPLSITETENPLAALWSKFKGN